MLDLHLMLLNLGRLRPDHLPAAAAFLVDVGVPEAPKRRLLPCERGLRLGLVAENRSFTVPTNLDRTRFPHKVVELTGSDLAEGRRPSTVRHRRD